MTPPPIPDLTAATSAPAASTLSIVLGVVFMLVWWGLAIVWGMMSLMGGLMANDSGSASSDKHMALLWWMFAGEVLIALAGLPGGLAFCLVGHRALLISLFAVLLVAGGAMQGWAMTSFYAK
ncbi:MAG: hypothetical protein JWO89_1761 [Verrucomicrobiaceae bacterium]|nr:hypothetical protein [Verrucomicrobiaceae bacterium]MDB6118348.1 hypothetical protein [Verrucomicrobiaceae bacterium]